VKRGFGSAQRGAGDLLGDSRLQADGATSEAEGTVENLVGQAKRMLFGKRQTAPLSTRKKRTTEVHAMFVRNVEPPGYTSRAARARLADRPPGHCPVSDQQAGLQRTEAHTRRRDVDACLGPPPAGEQTQATRE
jgi:uncharacterized protein YjbJ (UPF0337 family)